MLLYFASIEIGGTWSEISTNPLQNNNWILSRISTATYIFRKLLPYIFTFECSNQQHSTSNISPAFVNGFIVFSFSISRVKWQGLAIWKQTKQPNDPKKRTQKLGLYSKKDYSYLCVETKQRRKKQIVNMNARPLVGFFLLRFFFFLEEENSRIRIISDKKENKTARIYSWTDWMSNAVEVEW